MAELPLFGTNVDKSKVNHLFKKDPFYLIRPLFFFQVPPIHQKRIVNAFVNTFILKTATFLEDFVNQCEDKLLRFEVKLRQVDTQLKLIEAKLESVPAATVQTSETVKVVEEVRVVQQTKVEEVVTEVVEEIRVETVAEEKEPEGTPETPTGVKAKDDYRYKKYFKMIQFGVPPAAIKMKLQAEGMDPDILDTPNKILSDGVVEPIAIDSSDSESD